MKAVQGVDETSGSLFSYVHVEERIPARHPLRKIRQVVNDALVSLDADFAAPVATKRILRFKVAKHLRERLNGKDLCC